MRYLLVFAIVALLIASAASQLVDKLENGASAPADRPRAATASHESAYAGTTTLAVPGDRNGHFRVDASIGGRQLPLIVDTGATVIALTKRDAERLGIHPPAADFKWKIQTANGTIAAARTQLAAVSIGNLRVDNVEAVVMPDGALSQNLLGMSFLSRLRRFEFRPGQLILEQ